MITYVNTVLVSNFVMTQAASDNYKVVLTSVDDLKVSEGTATQKAAAIDALKGKMVVIPISAHPETNRTDKIKIGVVGQGYTTTVDKDGVVTYHANVKWSNEIKIADIKNIATTTQREDIQDKVTVDFSGVNAADFKGCVAVLRINYKDMPTRYRQWTESYDYIINGDETDLAAKFAAVINKQAKRARVFAESTPAQIDDPENQGQQMANPDFGKLILTAMPYDDDMDPNGENPTATVRFNVSMYYTNPNAAGVASSNKNELPVEIKKVPGTVGAGAGKYVLEREKNALGYTGVIHRCKWYDLKPSIVADPNGKYDAITIEFENMYRAADDIFRKTKQTVEIYVPKSSSDQFSMLDSTWNAIAAFIDGTPKRIKTTGAFNFEADPATAPTVVEE